MSETSQTIEERFTPFGRRMETAGSAPIVVETFKHYYTQLLKGETGMIAEAEIEPITELPDATKLTGYDNIGREALQKTAILKLNGGLGTGMGLEKAKSLLEVKNGLSFLDIIARQVLQIRRTSGSRLPVIFMNSFSTEADTLEALSAYPQLKGDLPLSFVQNKVPKILQDGFAPSEDESELSWCPPGHGDLYPALIGSGLLEQLLQHEYEYLFISNADNLGAVMDENILGYFAKTKLPFLMEAADRTPADSKGGHLARRTKDGRMVLREVAQCPSHDMQHFQDISRHRYFNTNNIWVHLPTLADTLIANDYVLKLPLIRNSKTLDPRDPNSPKVFQLETAVGAAIEVFEGAGALRVPRSRFAPVKLTSDLLVLRSDATVLERGCWILPNPLNKFGVPVVSLDSRFYKFVDDLQRRFPHGAPSLTACEHLKVEGDVVFGKNVTIKGRSSVMNTQGTQATVPDGTTVEGELRL
jgi:UTP--glucose-1-phosphate uridylyltransferase